MGQALCHYPKSPDIDSLNSQAHYSTGAALAHQRNFKDAIQYFQRTISLQLNLTFTMQQKGEAIEQFQKCLEINPQFASVHLPLAELTLDLARFADAVRHIETTLSVQPNYANALTLEKLAVSYVGARRFDQATQTAKAALIVIRND